MRAGGSPGREPTHPPTPQVQQLPSKTELPINSDAAQTWLITSYLDDDLRISRGDGGSVFVLIKDPPPPSLTPEMMAMEASGGGQTYAS